MDYNMVGPVLVLGLSAIGSSIGCGIAGEASHAVMSRVDEGRGKFIAMSVAPSSQSIYGLVLMMMMKDSVLTGSVSALSAAGIGLVCGLALMFSSIYQGKVCASGIQASARKPVIYGLCWAAIVIIESFSLFAFVFARSLI